MKKGIIYIHGKGGNAAEAEHYKGLFPKYDVAGLEYSAQTPWEAREEFTRFFDEFLSYHTSVSVAAVSIGALFAMHALWDRQVEKAYFISPIVDMERLITDMMNCAGISESELWDKKVIETPFGETLSWEYLTWVRNSPITWRVPTDILYGEKDSLQSEDTVSDFAVRYGCSMTVMPKGEHWFHTAEQTAFLDKWIKGKDISDEL